MALNPNISTFLYVQPADQELIDVSSDMILQSSETIISKSKYDEINIDLFIGKFRSKSEIEKQRF